MTRFKRIRQTLRCWRGKHEWESMWCGCVICEHCDERLVCCWDVVEPYSDAWWFRVESGRDCPAEMYRWFRKRLPV